MKKPMNEFGIRVAAFCAKYGVTKKQLADMAKNNPGTLHDICSGRTPGNSIIPKYEAAMRRYESAEHRRRKKEVERAVRELA